MRAPRALLALVLLAAIPAALALPVVPGEPVRAPKMVRAEAILRLAEGNGSSTRLTPVAAAELQKIRGENQRVQTKRVVIGRNRPMQSLAATPWVQVAGGQVTRITVTSPDAGSLRVALDIAGLPLDTEMVFRGSQPGSPLWGPVRVGDIPDRTVAWWSPLTEGEAQMVEFFAPNARSVRATPKAVGVSHVFTTPSSRLAKRTEDIGTSGPCNIDMACSTQVSTPGFSDAAHAVAEMVFTVNGYTAMCSATLLADTDPTTQIPWLFSANHCMDNPGPPSKSKAQMQSVAATLTTLWFFESSSCNGAPAAYRQLSSGATIAYADAASDVLLLRLNDDPPPGAYFGGWDANPIALGSGVTSIHHPHGDLSKVAQGTARMFSSPTDNSTGYIQVVWSTGTTEPGSSGASILTSDGSRYFVRGGLWGGAAECSTPTGPDYFSRLDLAYPALKAFLDPTYVPFANFTDMWWDPNESGWGINVIQHASNTIFAIWYTYDENRHMFWLHMSSGRWTSPSTYTGDLYQTSGPPMAGAFDPSRVQRTKVGTATLTFSGANSGTLSYTYYGMAGSKSLTRLAY